ncbi:conserved hypothetical protein [Neospora caninum Liverpool]|uniref:Uncharacterized protein n=1 Tax=Neospora caninum (strain Liverpool) TaxID=572307 RepID=F0V7Q3_NEOCL|nr:conserved hypothetical protein [Neospora caninum Liverpool]CBZ49744.1 conserved hypothetical protein [Neospora caninum Liverpool]CEL64328.1 TPA: hypothetical protein BN1204_002310 [Neospora caninum Liverpool]|eukprot:XP_003879779.1 conserved hypothetical protein [Neospora caninum Liverpool]
MVEGTPGGAVRAGLASFSRPSPVSLHFRQPPFGIRRGLLLLALLGIAQLFPVARWTEWGSEAPERTSCAGSSGLRPEEPRSFAAPHFVGVSAAHKAISEEAAAALGVQALNGILSQLGQLAKETTSAVRRSVHRSISEARQTDTFKSLKYAVRGGPVMPDGVMEADLAALGEGLTKYLARVDTVHPRERTTVLPHLLQKDAGLIHVMFKYAGLDGFEDVDVAFKRLKGFKRSFEELSKIPEGDRASSEDAEDEETDEAGDVDAGGKGGESPEADGKRAKRKNRARGVRAPSDAALLAEDALKLFEAELSAHLAFLTDVLSTSPEDAEILKRYTRRMLPRLKEAFKAAWHAASTTLQDKERSFHLRYLADYLREFGALDSHLGTLSEIMPRSQPPFNPENYYYGTPSIVPGE